MCGIVGFLNKDGSPAPQDSIRNMTATLAHRGPHDNGVHIHRNAAIGHRRLAIIDLRAGKQPMSNEDDFLWITYNGELYNYKELRKVLKSKGHIFKTNSDTEVVIHSYETWGKYCVEYFRGMFAFAIVDKKQEYIFLARDHIGIKPLVYLNNEKYFAFSSELQAFYALPAFNPNINITALDQYLTLRYIPAPITIYEDVYKLPPAHRMAVTFTGELVYNEQYWDVDFKPDKSKSEEDWLGELDVILRDSVGKHLTADVPVGALLSGGLDSTLIVKYIAEIQGDNNPHTYSIGFDIDDFSELPYAEVVSKKYGTKHHTKVVRPNSVDILPRLVKHYGEPFGDDSCVPTYYLSEFASEFVTVVLSGDGGDELFCGYHWYREWIQLLHGRFAKFFRNYPLWKKMVYVLLHHAYSSKYPIKYYERGEPTVENWIMLLQNINKNWKKKLWKEDFHHALDAIPRSFLDAADKIQNYSYIHKGQYLDIKSLLPSRLLPKVDIVSMMNGLEVRTPFADKDVVDFAGTIPADINLKKSKRGNFTGKYLLKKLLADDFDSDFIHRKKKGFNIPIRHWFSENGNKRLLFEEMLLTDYSHISEYFNRNIVKELYDRNEIRILWTLLFLEHWLEHIQTAHKRAKPDY